MCNCLRHKIHRQILPDQQHCITLRILMIITAPTAAAVDPAAVFHSDVASGIAIDFQGIGGSRQIAQIGCRECERIVVALVVQADDFDVADAIAGIRQVQIQAGTGQMQHINARAVLKAIRAAPTDQFVVAVTGFKMLRRCRAFENVIPSCT